MKNMASSSITSSEIDGETMETVRNFIFLDSKISVDDSCHEIKQCLLPWRKAMINLDKQWQTSVEEKQWQHIGRQHIKKQKHYFACKGLYHQSHGVASSHVYRCESWTIKMAEHWRIDAFKLWCWRRLLRVPWTARRSNPSVLKEINPEYSLEGLMLNLQYFGHLTWRISSLVKTLMMGKIEGRRRRGWQRMTWLDGITNSMDMSLNKLKKSERQGSLVWCSL